MADARQDHPDADSGTQDNTKAKKTKRAKAEIAVAKITAVQVIIVTLIGSAGSLTAAYLASNRSESKNPPLSPVRGNSTLNEAKISYLKIARLVLRIATCEENIRLAEEWIKLATIREKSGQITKLEVFNLIVFKTSWEVELAKTQNSLAEEKFQFKNVQEKSKPFLVEYIPIDLSDVTNRSGNEEILSIDEENGTIKIKKNGDSQLVFKKRDVATSHGSEERQQRLGVLVEELSAIERRVMLLARMINFSALHMEAAKISWERGLKESDYLSRAIKSFADAKEQFIVALLDMATVWNEVDSLDNAETRSLTLYFVTGKRVEDYMP